MRRNAYGIVEHGSPDVLCRKEDVESVKIATTNLNIDQKYHHNIAQHHVTHHEKIYRMLAPAWHM